MKLIPCILQDSDQDQVTGALLAAGCSATILSSTGDYFRRANTAEPSDPGLKRATVFVLNVDRFEQVQ